MWAALIPIVIRFQCIAGREVVGSVGGGGKTVNLYRLWEIYDNFRIMANDKWTDDDAPYSID